MIDIQSPEKALIMLEFQADLGICPEQISRPAF
jgi:hypothetical protein